MSELRKNCAPGIQSDMCRICLEPIMEGNNASWAHDNCIEREKSKEGRIHLPSPYEITAMTALIREDWDDSRFRNRVEEVEFTVPIVKSHFTGQRAAGDY